MRINRQLSGQRGARAVAVSLLAVIAALGVSGIAFAAGSAVLTARGPGNEGPYPYAYPASGHITAGTGKASAWVIPTDEDLMIALHSWALLGEKASA